MHDGAEINTDLYLHILSNRTPSFPVAEIQHLFIRNYVLPFPSEGKNGMIKFYQDWCGHCKRMKPDWDFLAKEAEPTNVKILDVNCGEQEKVRHCMNMHNKCK